MAKKKDWASLIDLFIFSDGTDKTAEKEKIKNFIQESVVCILDKMKAKEQFNAFHRDNLKRKETGTDPLNCRSCHLGITIITHQDKQSLKENKY